MSDKEKTAKLKEEIANLEKQMNHDHFSSVVDKARNEKQYARLKRLKKELKELEAGK